MTPKSARSKPAAPLAAVPISFENLVALFQALAGREPTAAERVEAKEVLDEERNAGRVDVDPQSAPP